MTLRFDEKQFIPNKEDFNAVRCKVVNDKGKEKWFTFSKDNVENDAWQRNIKNEFNEEIKESIT